MKLKSNLLMIMTIFPFLLPTLCLAAQSSVAVMSFNVSEEHYKSLGEEAAYAFSSALIDRGLKVIERQKLELVSQELKLDYSGLVDKSTIIKAGKYLSAKYFVFGNLANTSILNQMQSSFLSHSWVQTAQTTFSVKAIDAETGEVVFSGRETARKQKEVNSSIAPVYDKSMFSDAIEQAANKLADRLLSKLR